MSNQPHILVPLQTRKTRGEQIADNLYAADLLNTTEREACAKIADNAMRDPDADADFIARLIRQRGNL